MRRNLAAHVRQCWLELRKVAWPNRSAMTRDVTVLLMVVAVVFIVLGALELALGELAGRLRG